MECTACRTPAAEQLARLEKSAILPLPDTAFAKHVSQALRASLKLFSETEFFETQIVDARELGIHASPPSQNNEVKINVEWFEYRAAHKYSSCRSARFNEDAPSMFTCDHVIIQLFRHILDQVPKPANMMLESDFFNRKSSMINDVEMKVPLMPRGIELHPIPRGIRVSWETNAHKMDYSETLRTRMIISLHQEGSCNHLKEQLLYYSGTLVSINLVGCFA